MALKNISFAINTSKVLLDIVYRNIDRIGFLSVIHESLTPG